MNEKNRIRRIPRLLFLGLFLQIGASDLYACWCWTLEIRKCFDIYTKNCSTKCPDVGWNSYQIPFCKIAMHGKTECYTDNREYWCVAIWGCRKTGEDCSIDPDSIIIITEQGAVLDGANCTSA